MRDENGSELVGYFERERGERENIRWSVKGLDRNKDNRGEANREVDE